MTHTITKTRMYISDYLCDNHVALRHLFECLTRPLATEIAGRAFSEPVIMHANWKTDRQIICPDRICYTAELHWMPFKEWAHNTLIPPDAEFITSTNIPLTDQRMMLRRPVLQLK